MVQEPPDNVQFFGQGYNKVFARIHYGTQYTVFGVIVVHQEHIALPYQVEKLAELLILRTAIIVKGIAQYDFVEHIIKYLHPAHANLFGRSGPAHTVTSALFHALLGTGQCTIYLWTSPGARSMRSHQEARSTIPCSGRHNNCAKALYGPLVLQAFKNSVNVNINIIK